MGRSRLLLVLTATGLALAIAGIALVLVNAHNRSRNELTRNFQQRETVAAGLFTGLLAGTVQSGSAPRDLSQAHVTDAMLLRARQDGMLQNSVYDAVGNRLATYRFVPGWPDTPPAQAQADVIQAAASGVYIGDIAGTPPRASLDIGTAFQTPYGMRVEVTKFPLTMISSILPTYMRTMAGLGGNASIVDSSGRAIASSLPQLVPGAKTPDQPLLRQILQHHHGSFRARGAAWHYNAGHLDGTSWSIVLTVRDSVLYSPLSGSAQLVQWIALGLLSLLGIIALGLVNRTRRDSLRLAAANANLELRNAEVERADAAKSKFLAGMSHELRTPLNGIIGFAELMYDGKVGPLAERHREYMGDILGSARHLLALINDVLDISKVEAGRMEFDRQWVDLGELTRKVESGLRRLAEDQGVTIEADVGADLDRAFVDPRKFRQILVNYLSNAIKFTPRGGYVCIRLRADGDTVALEVQDTGIGIAPEDVGKLFTEFAQLSPSVHDNLPGTGLGLALTKRLVEAQGGTVSVTSEPGSGSVFGAVLPRCRPDQPPPLPFEDEATPIPVGR
jgi:signal transduction histidine kinase